jgi:hypothetical protein
MLLIAHTSYAQHSYNSPGCAIEPACGKLGTAVKCARNSDKATPVLVCHQALTHLMCRYSYSWIPCAHAYLVVLSQGPHRCIEHWGLKVAAVVSIPAPSGDVKHVITGCQVPLLHKLHHARLLQTMQRKPCHPQYNGIGARPLFPSKWHWFGRRTRRPGLLRVAGVQSYIHTCHVSHHAVQSRCTSP